MLAKHALSQLSYGPRRYKGQALMRADPKSCSFSEEERETKTADIRTCKATGSDKIRVLCSKCSKDLISDCSAIMVERNILRKEVIQPQVPLRLPCYDFTPVAELTVVRCLLTVGARPSGGPNSHGVTGGVYKARERIHRVMLLRDY